GIRGFHVTGVQTCALPIWGLRGGRGDRPDLEVEVGERVRETLADQLRQVERRVRGREAVLPADGDRTLVVHRAGRGAGAAVRVRSEERRVGKGRRTRAWAG